jgi:riboflavin transporter FmnP
MTEFEQNIDYSSLSYEELTKISRDDHQEDVRQYDKQQNALCLVVIGGIIFGPVYSIVIELVKNILELVIKGMGTQMGFGNLMNFIVGCAFAVPYSIIIRRLYKKKSDKGQAVSIIVASAVSTIITVGLGFFAKLGIAPLFFKYFLNIDLDFNGALNAAVAATVFNPIKCAILIVIMAIVVSLALPRIRKAIRI